MIAALPMYRWPETAGATDLLWRLVRDGLRARGLPAPEALGAADWEGSVALGQVCNLPWRRRYDARLNGLGCWDAALPGIAPGFYASAFVVSRGAEPDPAAHLRAPFAVNEWDSHSGWGAPWGWAAERGLAIEDAFVTGSHRESARAVARGTAAMACIDLVALRLLARHEPETHAALTVLEVTRPSPGQTFATSLPPAPVADALRAAIKAIGPEAHDALGLHGLAPMPPDGYADLPDPPRPSGLRLHPAPMDA